MFEMTPAFNEKSNLEKVYCSGSLAGGWGKGDKFPTFCCHRSIFYINDLCIEVM